ncbi:hypothetical protein ElyMa_004087800 [Elysia marginata]|uniref:Uncharacterized protein n=1 Tax=Elysia marginata TaxID=1093978 RepID=A0AAV4G997_9GAST|nr:hypothetical protein ElyMa_004087800 [Elysia marginata]
MMSMRYLSTARLCSPRPRPIWSPTRYWDPCAPRYHPLVNYCEPCYPANYLNVYCNKPEGNPCYDFSSCDLSGFCKRPKDPPCTYFVRSRECCLHPSNFDPWCTDMPPACPDVYCPAPAYCVPRPSSLCRSCTTLCSPVMCADVDGYSESEEWDPYCISQSRPTITSYRPPPRDCYYPPRTARYPRRTPRMLLR